MKIALDGSLLGARFSGVERSVAQLARHLPGAGGPADEVLLYVGTAFEAYCEQFHPDGFSDNPRLRVIQTGLDNTNRLARAWWQQVVLPRQARADEADVCHGPGYITAAMPGVPTVVTLYDLIYADSPSDCLPANRLHYQLAVPAGVRAASRVIVPSAAVRRAVATHLPEAYEKTVVVPLGVETRFGEPATLDFDLHQRYRLPEQYLLWVGNVEPKKNLGVLLDALVELNQHGGEVPKLVLAGRLSWGTNDLMRKFLASGLQDQVIFLGRVRDEHLPALYQGALGFLFPSRHEGFGLPPLEAMAAGVPTIVSDDPALSEVVGQAALIVPAGEPTAWAAAIERLAGDEPLRANLRAQGRARAALYHWEQTATATWQVYRAVASAEQVTQPGRALAT